MGHIYVYVCSHQSSELGIVLKVTGKKFLASKIVSKFMNLINLKWEGGL